MTSQPPPSREEAPPEPSAANGALPVAAPTREMTPAEPIYDGEVVDDLPGATRRAVLRRFVSWWRRCPGMPVELKSRPALRQAARDLIAWVVCSPFRFAGAVTRGLVVAARGWRRWVRVHDYREAAEQAEKLADKFIEIRALTLFRWKLTAAAIWAGAAAVTVADLLYGARAVWIVAGVGAVALAVTGRRTDGSPGRKAVLAGPRTLTWTMDPQVLVDAFRDAKLIGKDESLRLVERATRIGDGWAITVDLPATRKAADVIRHRDALASALAVDEVQLIVERVRGKGGHAGRVFLWVADEDPYSGLAYTAAGRGELGRVAASALRPGRALAPDRPSPGVDLPARRGDPPARQDLRDPPPRGRADPGPLHAAVCVRRQGRQGLGRGRSGGLPVRARRRTRPRLRRA
jgi:DNA segregation ATPase FtsK/SpoIIIE, S-DNA-T family